MRCQVRGQRNLSDQIKDVCTMTCLNVDWMDYRYQLSNASKHQMLSETIFLESCGILRFYSSGSYIKAFG